MTEHEPLERFDGDRLDADRIAPLETTAVHVGKIVSGVDFVGTPKRDDPYGLRREINRRRAKDALGSSNTTT